MSDAITANQDTGLIFIHVPKCAGTTLNTIIHRQYPAKNVYYVRGNDPGADIRNFMNLPEPVRARSRCVIGHSSYGLHTYFVGPVQYITMLRNPISRIVSHYNYVKRTPDNPFYEWVISNNISLVEYVESRHKSEMDNGITRLLCGNPNVDTIMGHDDLPPNALDDAKRNLESMACVGIVEDFDSSLLMFQRALGWGNIFYRRQNQAPQSRPIKLSAEARRAIEKANTYDLELYEFAQKLYQQQKQLFEVNNEMVNNFRQRNRIVNSLLVVRDWTRNVMDRT